MRICRFSLEGAGVVLAAVTDEEEVRPLKTLGQDGEEPTYITSWEMLRVSGRQGVAFYQAVEELVEHSPAFGTFGDLEAQNLLLSPLDKQEVWAAGVTYWRSREARMDESEAAASFYDMVYEAERPELFFKATPHRVAGPGDFIGVRGDSHWNVPEPELAVLLDSHLTPLGLTICNDVSSRDIEGANPLYLPQAKVYNNSCALGPVILLIEQLEEKPQLRIECTIKRDGLEVFHGGASTGQLKRTLPDLISYLGRYNSFPDGVVLSTGTCIVPPDDFTLQEGDLVEIEIEGIGRLSNPVRVLQPGGSLPL